eukprot:767345-Hanusia_phi.AAC.2
MASFMLTPCTCSGLSLFANWKGAATAAQCPGWLYRGGGLWRSCLPSASCDKLRNSRAIA